MLDFADRDYIAEVIRTGKRAEKALSIAKALLHEPVDDIVLDDQSSVQKTRIFHSFVRSTVEYHRSTRTRLVAGGESMEIPRRKRIRGKTYFLYDVVIAQRGSHLVVAVPFHRLAEEFFLKLDVALAGSKSEYQKLDITRLVIEMGDAGILQIPSVEADQSTALSVTRCHLVYADRTQQAVGLKQIQMTGPNLGASAEYGRLIRGVLKEENGRTATPTVLGFALLRDGVRRASAITDRHGNFKLWMAPGLRQLLRLFDLLDTISDVTGVLEVTGNLPILLGTSIEKAES